MTAPKHCPHCGQQHPAADQTNGDQSAHWVEQDVLDCFNAAFAEAAWRAAQQVDLVHLVFAMCRNESGRIVLTECGLDVTVLTAVLSAELPPLLADHAETTRPRTSEDLSRLLTITRQTAVLHGSRYLSLRHLAGTLLSPPRSLAGGDMVTRWFWAARRFPGHGSPRTLPPTSRAATETTATGDSERTTLFERLDRQERMLHALLRSSMSLPVPASSSVAEATASDSAMQASQAVDSAEARRDAAADMRLRSVPSNVVPLDDTPEFEPAEPGHEPDPELEKLGVRRYYLSLDDEVVRAPSIGPRTAARLHPHGITHVKHLLSCDPERLSVRLGVRHITASRIVAWKNQARLVCTIPWLRGTHAQLLVGAGYSSIERILSTDRSTVCAAVSQFATTKDGQSILRAGPPPELDRIMRWIENSQQAEPQRALTQRLQVN